ncbi:HAD family hydrolase [Tamlana sp. 2_MG-2023]|uniref:HAD family hydrolase n=1 Tax=unclassified Tamlana TaxID=2614803 RepID=UPI0026E4665A|nr:MULTISPECIES: HAD family hydrolase [unclassified Tamlana]MDO6761391.1 HAD family hydrolase [Tamlana sp. 2_MG-2023]MDO6791995.1 HAD family hydrolase [Tamlana sp. 1_MG-2023]
MKTKNTFQAIILAVVLVITTSCNSNVNKETTTTTEVETTTEVKDPLPSWAEGKTKESIKSYVTDVTTEGSSNFIPVADRIATFDNDGTLWSEQPAYFQLFFAISRIKDLAPEHPEWKNKQPYKAVLENDMKSLMASGEKGLIEIVMTTHAGMTAEAFEKVVKDWFTKDTHPRFKKPFNTLIFQPMLELLDYLRANDFKTYIVSGGGVEFMRPWVEEAYGIPKEQVVGSSIKTEFVMENGKAQIKRLPAIDFIDDKAGKPVGINKFIGKKPVFTAGNSDGDLQMMQYGDSNKYPSFQLYVHHTDAEREWAYDRESHIGQFNKGLDYATENGWTIIDMKKDWKVIYPFQLNETKN